jgi:hypothetical protein
MAVVAIDLPLAVVKSRKGAQYKTGLKGFNEELSVIAATDRLFVGHVHHPVN